MTQHAPWWRDAAIYQVYLRSFADSNGDGIGDLRGLRDRLGYLAGLGVDAIWLNPWYPSPMADAGYDIADYRDIDPVFGTLAEADALIAEAHDRGIKIIIDVVPNHSSNEHAWFLAALAAGPGSPERDRFWFRPGRGPDGDLPPNNWSSIFGGPAWTRVTDPDGRPGEWYLHLFAPEQPDFNWANADVRAEFLSVLRFWFDRGVDGIRIDSAAILVKDPLLADMNPEAPDGNPEAPDGTRNPPHPHPYVDRDGIHEIYQGWREVADGYPGERALIGEIWLPDPHRLALYLRPTEMHTAFNFAFLQSTWDAGSLRKVIDDGLALGAPATWVLSNHDVTRHVTRYGRAHTGFDFADRRHGEPLDLDLGTRRARAAALLTLALPGAVYMYQGEELGLWEVEDLPPDIRQDPIWHRNGGADPGRDGCRVPIPWSGTEPPYGFSPDNASIPPWLPQPPAWREHTVETETGDPSSMLELYRAALRLRTPADLMQWLPPSASQFSAPQFSAEDAGVLAFRRGDIACVVNLSGDHADLPPHATLLLASQPLASPPHDSQPGSVTPRVTPGVTLPPDTAVWLRLRP